MSLILKLAAFPISLAPLAGNENNALEYLVCIFIPIHLLYSHSHQHHHMVTVIHSVLASTVHSSANNCIWNCLVACVVYSSLHSTQTIGGRMITLGKYSALVVIAFVIRSLWIQCSPTRYLPSALGFHAAFSLPVLAWLKQLRFPLCHVPSITHGSDHFQQNYTTAKYEVCHG